MGMVKYLQSQREGRRAVPRGVEIGRLRPQSREAEICAGNNPSSFETRGCNPAATRSCRHSRSPSKLQARSEDFKDAQSAGGFEIEERGCFRNSRILSSGSLDNDKDTIRSNPINEFSRVLEFHCMLDTRLSRSPWRCGNASDLETLVRIKSNYWDDLAVTSAKARDIALV